MSGPRWRLGVPAEMVDPPLDVDVFDSGTWESGVLTMRRRDHAGAWWCYVCWRPSGSDKAGWLPYAAGLVRPLVERHT